MSTRFELPEWLGEQPEPVLPPVDDHRVEDLVNRFIAGKQEALFTAPDAFYRAQGGEAVAGAPAIADRLQALRTATLDQARDDGERAALGPRLDLHVADALGGIDRHVAAQRTVHQRHVLAERQRLIRRAAELEPDNDDKIDGLAEAHASTARELARLDGVAPDSPEEAEAQANARSQILRAAIEQRIGAATPDKAVTLYDRVKATLSPADRRALELPLGVATDEAATDAWLARETDKDGAPLADRAGLDDTLTDQQRLILRAKIGARDSAEESRRFATVKGLDDRLAAATATLATQPALYRPGTLAQLADAYADAGAPEQADETRRLALLETYFRTLAQAGAAAQQRHLADLSGPERAMAEAIVRHQQEAFAHDPYAAGTALYPDVGPPLPEEDAEGRLRQARMIEAMLATPAAVETTGNEVEAPSDAFLPKFITDRPTWTDDSPSRLGAGDPALIQATDPQGESQANGEQLAQAAPQPPGAPPQKQKTTPPKQPAKRPQPAPVQHVSPKEAQQRAARWDEIIRGQPDTSTQPLLPDDWQKTQNQQYVAWIRDASKETGVPLELLARHLWKESTFDPTKSNGQYKGMGQLGSQAIATIGAKEPFDYFDAKSSIYATASYLAHLHKAVKSWSGAVAAYNAGPTRVGAWLRNEVTSYRPVGETVQAIRHVFRGDPKAFDE